MNVDINSLTLGQIKEIAAITGSGYGSGYGYGSGDGYGYGSD